MILIYIAQGHYFGTGQIGKPLHVLVAHASQTNVGNAHPIIYRTATDK
jgi:hypothetical protein